VKIPVTAIVITRNEEANIERCLRSLSFCEQVVVVDSGSTDKTHALALRFTDSVFEVPWAGFAAQKNNAIAHARHEWILSVDADEVVPPDLAEEITSHFRTDTPDVAAFSIPRKTIHFGRWIRHGGWYPNRLVRLFAKGTGRWEGEELHESWITTGETGNLLSDLEHYSFSDLADQVSRNNRYSSLGATKLQRKGANFSSFWLLVKPTSKFLETYIFKRGFLDGYPGFIISVSAAYSVFLKWAKLWELEHAEN
jgi:glycosyltransferase involved in cell wall biosynthesis